MFKQQFVVRWRTDFSQTYADPRACLEQYKRYQTEINSLQKYRLVSFDYIVSMI